MKLTAEMIRKLSDSPLLVALTDDQTEKFFNAGEVVEYKAGDEILTKDTFTDALFLIVSGRVAIQGEAGSQYATLSGEPTMQEQYEGDFFGEMSFLDHEPASANVKAVETTLAFRIEKETLFLLFGADTEFQVVLLMNMGRILSRRLRRSNIRTSDRAENF